MRLYVNGGEHTVGAYATNEYGCAKDDQSQWALQTLAHPDNQVVTWVPNVANILKMSLESNARFDNNNFDIIDGTLEWANTQELFSANEVLIIVQLSEIHNMKVIYNKLIEMHERLSFLGYKHIIFNSDNVLQTPEGLERYDFGKSYIEPYQLSFKRYLSENNIKTSEFSDEFYGKEGHSFWAQFLIKYIIRNKIV